MKVRPTTLVAIFVMAFLYLPILALVLNSFNASRFSSSWEGWTLQWYEILFSSRSRDIWEALQRSLIVAVAASFASMILGTLAAWAIHRYRTRLQRAHFGFIYLPIVAPDILMGLSLAIFLVTLGVNRSLGAITVAHVTFCLSYVALSVLARLQDFDDSLVEAGRDLGATRWQVATRIVLPLIAPGVLAGGLIAFTLSIDDFVITFFVKGVGSDTLPLRIYSMTKHSKEMPVVNALSTLLILFNITMVVMIQRLVRPGRDLARS